MGLLSIKPTPGVQFGILNFPREFLWILLAGIFLAPMSWAQGQILLNSRHPAQTPVLTPGFMKGARTTPLFRGPGKSYGVSGSNLSEGEIVYFEGISLSGEWAKVILRSGEEHWTPYYNLISYSGPVERRSQFLDNVKSRHALTSSLSAQVGGAYGPRPMLGRVAVGLLWNWFPEGLVDFRYDQTELGMTGSYLVLGNEEAFFHTSIFMQWLYRMGEFKDFMIGPRMGWALMNDPTSKFSYSNFLVLGLASRMYPTDHFGFFVEAETFVRTTVYVMGSAGFSIRF